MERNIKKLLTQTRELCKGMSEELYALSDYMSKVVDEDTLPIGLTLSLVLALDDIHSGISHCDEEIPEYVKKHSKETLTQAVYFPQIIDSVTDECYAKEFREICKETLDFDPPVRVNPKLNTSYPKYIEIAVDWWANAILSPIIYFPAIKIPTSFYIKLANKNNSINSESMLVFKEALAKEIEKAIKKSGNCCLDVDYAPNFLLQRASIAADIRVFPLKTTMWISENEITVCNNSKTQIIWSK